MGRLAEELTLVKRGQAAEMGMWLFLATEALFFGVIFAAYGLLRLSHPEAVTIGSRATDLLHGGINSAVLLTSGLFAAFAVRLLEGGFARQASLLLVSAALLGTAFLAFKGVEYLADWQQGLVPGLHFTYAGPHAREVELFFFAYFFSTALHALHLLLGVALLAVMAAMTWLGRFDGRPLPVVIAVLYWHFVDLVWIFLFPLLYLAGRG